jgi:hypothetical protein
VLLTKARLRFRDGWLIVRYRSAQAFSLPQLTLDNKRCKKGLISASHRLLKTLRVSSDLSDCRWMTITTVRSCCCRGAGKG